MSTGAVRPAAARELIGRVAAHVEPAVGDVAARLVERVLAEMEFVADDPRLRGELEAGTLESVRLITAMVRSWTDPHVVSPPAEVITWAQGLAARGVPVSELLRVYRIGQAGYQEVWIRELASAGAGETVVIEAIVAVTGFIATAVDAISSPLVEAYETERERRRRGMEAVRAEVAELVLSGKPFDVARASARLGYELEREHIAAVAWTDGDAGPGQLDAAAGSLVAHIGDPARPPLLLHDTRTTLLIWIARPRAGGVVGPAVPSGVQIATGRPWAGADGFRRSHDEARRAQRVAGMLGVRRAVTRFDDVAVLDLLTRDADAARAFMCETLGPLGNGDAQSRRLLAALHAYFVEGQRFARAARRLHVPENTMRGRVRRALEVAGYEDVDPLRLRVAVELAQLADSTPAAPDPGANHAHGSGRIGQHRSHEHT
jgi:GGDEF-like domain/PucR C-terminal helix-turn-helix domain